MTYNMHNLCHLATNVLEHGPLDNTSAFPFENFMFTLKNSIRKPNFVVTQIYNRCAELNQNLITAPYTMTLKPKLYKKKPDSETFNSCKMGQTVYSNSLRDCGGKLKNNTFIKILFFSTINDVKYVHYKKLIFFENVFEEQFVWSPLKHYGIFPCSVNSSQDIEMCDIRELDCKVCVLPLFHRSLKNIYVAIPLLH